jgi:hypothetical protein
MIIWFYSQWCARWPSLGSDEWFRHTVVIPWPWTSRTDDDGDPLYRAVCVVVAPWWLCRYIFSPEHRRYARWQRGLQVALGTLPEPWTSEAFDVAYDGYIAAVGEQPPFAKELG